jgi:hypothetical protein
MQEETVQTKAGRPTDYTVELGDSICVKLAEGKSLSSICAEDGMPARSTVLLWVVKGERGDETYVGFSDSYMRARQSQAHALMDDVLDIADDSSRDVKIVRGQEVMNTEFVARSRLRVDARFKLAAQQHPELYGERVKQEITGRNGEPLASPAFRVEFVNAPKRDDDDTGPTAG